MTHQDRFDQRLSERLRAAEDRTPGAAAPGLPQPADRRRWTPLATVGAAGLLAGVVLVGVLVQPPAPPAGGGTPSPTASGAVLIALPTQPPYAGETPGPCMDALLTGTLVPDDADGFAILSADGHRERVVWPYGYVGREGTRRELLDGDGQVVAAAGDLLRIGGGNIGDGVWEACPYAIEVVTTLPSSPPSPSPSATAVPSTAPSGPWTSGTIEAPDASNYGPYFNGVRWFPGIGWLAFGQDGSALPGDGGPVLWHSDDGLAWARAAVPSGLDGFGVRDVEVAALAHGPQLVAVAHDFQHSAILVSSDGVSWELADTPSTGALLTVVAYGEAGFVAVGTDRDPAGIDVASGVAWRSPDGLSWQATAPAALRGAVPATLETIAGAGYLALGWFDGEAPPRTIVWTSSDGVSWQGNLVRPAQNEGGSLGIISDSDGQVLVAAGLDPSAYAAISIDGADWNFEPLPEPQADPIAIDISSKAIVMVAFVYVADGPSATLVWVRDLPAGTWRTVDWRSQVTAPEAFVGAAGVAIGPGHTLIMFSNGRVLLTGGSVP